jgi:hypothetical protein
MSNTLNYLQNQYGPLMNMGAVAKTFDRSKEGLRVCLSSNTPFSVAINSAKKRYGRRVYFKTEVIAELIDNDVLA